MTIGPPYQSQDWCCFNLRHMTTPGLKNTERCLPYTHIPRSCASARSIAVANIFLYVQVTYPPPHVGYDHNWALFGLGMDAANKTHIGAISNECATLHLA